ncbi:MAG: undecaprenyl-diphosphate phosphatase [Deltaproteobacteria bacterium]|nr:undecaprenyl-diphosphate phosphatase [Deltaproteobacteria bacterium]
MVTSLLLGIIQGLTEFLPISSSGHLVIIQKFFPPKSSNLFFDVMLHFGTLMAVLFYFRKDLYLIFSNLFIFLRDFLKNKKLNLKQSPYILLFFFIIIGSIPAGLIGFFLENWIETLFIKPQVVGITFLITGFILFGTKFASSKKKGIEEMKIIDSFFIGLAQAAALLPGISRSGTTISTGIFLGFKKDFAFNFSFLLSIPAVLGATFFEFFHVTFFQKEEIAGIIIGTLSAAFTGYLTLKLLIKIIRKGKFYYFSYYCFLAGIFTILCL